MTALRFLEWALAVTGVVAFALSMVCWRFAMMELLALRIEGINGRYLAGARHHLWRSVFRAIPAALSFFAGAWLLSMPDDPSSVDVVAKSCWLAYQVAMIANLGIELWTNAKITEEPRGH